MRERNPSHKPSCLVFVVDFYCGVLYPHLGSGSGQPGATYITCACILNIINPYSIRVGSIF